MRDQIGKLIEQNKIDIIIIEQVRPQYNSHTNKILMWLQGTIAIKAHQLNPKIQIRFIGASSWRSVLKIKQGRGVKREQVKGNDIRYVKEKYQIIAANDDQADAICLFDSS